MSNIEETYQMLEKLGKSLKNLLAESQMTLGKMEMMFMHLQTENNKNAKTEDK